MRSRSDGPVEVIAYTQAEYYLTRSTRDGQRMIVWALIALVVVYLLVYCIPDPPAPPPSQLERVKK